MAARAFLLPSLALALLAVPLAARADPALDALAQDVSRTEGLRATKTLQRLFAQYAQFGLWADMGALFAAKGTFTFDGQIKEAQTSTGPAAIAAFLRARYGAGHDGLLPGDVRTMMIEAPLVNLAADGESAKGRWYMLVFTGTGDRATIEGGTFENDYVRDRGVWKIAAARYQPLFHGPYETGWTNWGGGNLPVIPYHFTPDSAGIPIPAATGPAPKTQATLAQLGARIDALNDEDAVRNLQAAYGYYVDRKMWSDVTDLFAQDGAIEVGGMGVWRGPAGVRKWLETMGPEGLKHGQLNDRPQFDMTVTVMPGGKEAYARGIELGMLGEADQEKGWWEISVYRNRYVKEGGTWKIREMRHFPLVKADYYQGWGKSRIVDPVPTGSSAPDAALPGADAAPAGLAMPAFIEKHPVTGKVVAPAGQARLVASTALTPAIVAPKSGPLTLAEARRRLSVSTAYDGVENVSSAYTNYLDDYQSQLFGALIAEKGFKMSAFAGYYVGRARVTEAGVRVWGKPPVTREGIHFHWRPQSVILVSDDGRSANLHVRLFQPRTGKTVGGPGAWYGANFMTGKYHDQFVLENGVWRMWNLSLDEPYAGTVDWKTGWAKAKDPAPRPPQANASTSVLVSANSDFQPDVPVKALGKRQEHFRGGTGEPLQWPSILPMWFEYRNLVSGRVPENFQADCPPCTVRPDLRLDHHGYQQPPMGPPAPAQP